MQSPAEVVPQQGQAFEEKRVSHRRRVLKGATLNFNNGYGSFECRVRNLTEFGAMLEMGETLGVPNRFELKLDEHHSTVAEIVWRTERKVGVRYI